MHRVAVLYGVACFAFIAVGGLAAALVPEWMAQLAWIALACWLSARCAYREPRLSWRAGAIVMGVQLPCFYTGLLATGELFHPSGSTGGMVGLFLGTLFILFVSPLPMLAATIAARARRRHDARVQSPSGAPQ